MLFDCLIAIYIAKKDKHTDMYILFHNLSIIAKIPPPNCKNRMDLSQTKLSKSEWSSVEIPVSEQEKRILSLILEGYINPDIRTNRHLSLIRTMKVEASDEMEYCLYKTYFFDSIIDSILSTSTNKKDVANRKIKPPNKADQIRIQKLNTTIESQRNSIFDFVLLDHFNAARKGSKSALYTLLYLRKLIVPGVNRFLLEVIDKYLSEADTDSAESICDVFSNSTTYIERNNVLMEYADETLYSHQRDLFRIFSDRRKKCNPKCVLYMAPTGTGKTLSPIGLSQEYRVLFVCAARHVGLALAKSAISVGKRVAFAFGCETSSDIRLHYFAAADYTVNKKSGGIYKVDNSNGIRVEIMICDVASYLIAMYYMKSFHSVDKIITYWDEPTIGMDKDPLASDTKDPLFGSDTKDPLASVQKDPLFGSDQKDPLASDKKMVPTDPIHVVDEESLKLHNLIHRVWSLNQIPNIVLSCATLPKPDEIGGALQDFRAKFCNGSSLNGTLFDGGEPEIHVIDSHDCKKTISLLGKDGKIALPHLLFADYSTLIMNCVEHCEANRSLLRYFDVAEIVRFVEKVQLFLREEMQISKWFKSIDSVTLLSIKLYYLEVLRELPAEHWSNIYQFMVETLNPRFSIHIVDSDIRKIKSECHSEPSKMALNPLPRMEFTRQNSVSSIPPPILVTKSTTSTASGILLTTVDAHTLTDGPTIYLAEDIEKVGRFYIQQSKIPENVFSTIQQKIDKNNLILKQIRKVEQEIELKVGSTTSAKDEKSSKKAEKDPVSKEAQKLLEKIQDMRAEIQTVHLNSMYIPNTRQHQDIWLNQSRDMRLPLKSSFISNAFVPNVDEEDVRDIMALDVENQQKLLLILGIGVFSKSSDPQYAEIMKRLAYEQRLFLIIASSDYIYGTNYQFCHGFIGKDLANMTQQKTIQAIGRIGRNNIQQEYTVRFRDDTVLERLFKKSKYNMEAVIMNRLFYSDE